MLPPLLLRCFSLGNLIERRGWTASPVDLLDRVNLFAPTSRFDSPKKERASEKETGKNFLFFHHSSEPQQPILEQAKTSTQVGTGSGTGTEISHAAGQSVRNNSGFESR